MRIKGTARVGRRTKELIGRLGPGEIAIIDHPDLDEVAAEGLIGARVRGVINAAPSISGRFPNRGPRRLVEAGIPLIDRAGEAIFQRINDGDQLEIDDGAIFSNGALLGYGVWLTPEAIDSALAIAHKNWTGEIERFVANTLAYAEREKALIHAALPRIPLRVRMAGRHALVVVRGHRHREDLLAIRTYVEQMRPVLIGVDGGADALLEYGLCPDIIIGDMDSVSDAALLSGAQLIVHAYPDGRAPGLERLRARGLPAEVLPAPGTSEDVALLLAYERGATLIVAVGTHSNVLDFLEKGRAGMASTLLVRLKVGDILVDAKGVSELYRARPAGRHLVQLALAALVPIGLVFSLSEVLRQWTRLLALQLRVWVGW
ncbi:MAG TPA: putative cytokinetic ring protein SteA [Limnochordia bacterium]